ncbi:MAG: hypothetical protein DSY76_04830, partial [Bacteroidetes bacterium]
MTLNQNIDLRYVGLPIQLIIRGTLKMYTGFLRKTTHNLKLPNNSTIIIEDGGKIDGHSKYGFFSGKLKSTTMITAGDTVIYNHHSGAAGQPAGDLSTLPGPVRNIPTTGDPLPVELLSFTAKTKANAVNLQWQTATETNSQYFEVQCSADGENWISLDEIAAAGNSNELIDYQYIDQNPINGDNYYRLLQMDYNGDFEYFGPVFARYANTIKKADESNN